MLKRRDYSNRSVDFLVERCRKDDRTAQFEVYKRYSKAMFNICLRYLNDPFESEDVMQEAFVSAFGKLNGYSGTVTFGAWLKKIMVNKCIDHLRSKTKKLNVEEPLLNQDVADISEDDESENTEAKVEEIKETIQKLPEGYRIIVSLHLIEGYDHEEIAEILGITSSTSRSQFIRAKRRLLKLLNATHGKD